MMVFGLLGSSAIAGRIQDMIEAADSGSSVEIPAGIHYVELTMSESITLKGQGREVSILDGNRFTNIVFITTGVKGVYLNMGFKTEGQGVIFSAVARDKRSKQ